MKKYLLYTLFGAASLMASCTEDFNEDVAAPQQWEQEENITLPSLQVGNVGSIDLATAGDSVTVFTAPNTSAIPEGTIVTNYRLVVGLIDGDITINAGDNGKVATADLQALIEKMFGKRPEERTIVGMVHANLMKEDQAIFITAGGFEIKATPVAPQISQHYYLIGAPSAWDPTCVTMPFNHSDKDVYEDPIFTIVFPIADGETWFAVTDDITVEKNDWKQVFGCAEGNGNNGAEGSLKRRADLTDDGSFKVVVNGDAKFIKMTLNMMEYTYKIEKLNFEEFIYVPGNHQGWSPATAPRLQSASFDGKYVGYSCLDGGFKFTSAPDWNHTNYGDGGEGMISDTGGDLTGEKGFYLLEVDLTDMTWKATPTAWGIIGDATPNGWDADQDMTWNEEKHCWSATVTLTDGTFKFRANDGWDINFGGNPDNLSAGGGNIPVTAGTYDIDLYLERTASENIYCTLTKK